MRSRSLGFRFFCLFFFKSLGEQAKLLSDRVIRKGFNESIQLGKGGPKRTDVLDFCWLGIFPLREKCVVVLGFKH